MFSFTKLNSFNFNISQKSQKCIVDQIIIKHQDFNVSCIYSLEIGVFIFSIWSSIQNLRNWLEM